MILFEKQVIKQGDLEEPIIRWEVGFWCPQGLAVGAMEAIEAFKSIGGEPQDAIPCCIAIGSTLKEVIVRSV